MLHICHKAPIIYNNDVLGNRRILLMCAAHATLCGEGLKLLSEAILKALYNFKIFQMYNHMYEESFRIRIFFFIYHLNFYISLQLPHYAQ